MPLVDLRSQATRRGQDEMVQHLKSFNLDLKFSVGVWYFSAGTVRWHARFSEPRSMEQVLDVCKELKPYGVGAVEAHYPNEINEKNLDLFKSFARDTGIKVLTVIPNLFYDAEYEFGSLSSPIESVRRGAIDRTRVSLELNRELDTDFAVVWPGGDGYENPFGLDFYGMWDRFEEGIAEAMDAVPGVRVAIEPKPYEPRGVNVWRHTPNGILMARNVEARLKNAENRRILGEGHTLVGLNPEVGHVLMGYEDLPYAFSSITREARLMHTHWNSQPLGNFDQDLNIGVVSPEQNEAALYALKMYGYQGWFGLDLYPERMPVQRAVINSIDALRVMNDRINSLNHEAVVACVSQPNKNRGYLEALLLRARAQNPDSLGPLPPWES